jgi:hypothetical protein
MDHHYSKDMFFLKAASDEEPAVAGEIELIQTAGEDTGVNELIEETPVTGEGDEIIGEIDEEPVSPEGDIEAVAPDPELGLILPLQTKETDVPGTEVPQDIVTDDGTSLPEDSLK